MNPWDEIADSGGAPDNMCHVSVKECLKRLEPILGLHGPLLDLGCGIGRLTEPIAELIHPNLIYGVDCSSKLLQIASSTWADDLNAEFMLNDGKTLPVFPEFLAGAFSIGMFQHVDDVTMQSYIAQVEDRLQPGGVFVYQFVYEGEPGPLSFIRDYDVVRQWGIIPTEGLFWDQKNKWCWITAVKK